MGIKSYNVMLIGRIIAGVCVGMNYSVMPVYIGEMIPSTLFSTS